MEQLSDAYEKYIEQLANVRGIEVKAIPLYKTLSSGIKEELPVLFQIMGGKMLPDTKRQAINLAIVLDRSGSMDGSKLENSKKAVKKLIEKLGENDCLHFVIYDDKVNTVFSNVTSAYAKDSLEKVDAVHSGGCTDLFEGVKRGVELVREYSTSTSVDAVMLFSDGNANRGICNIETIGRKIKEFHKAYGIHFTTFGIGDGFNEKLLSSIARCGRGYYFYIDDEERIPSLVRKAYDGSVNLLAKDLTLQVKGLNGSVLTKMENCTNLSCGREFPSVREFGFHQVLAHVTVNTNNVFNEFSLVGERHILQYRLSFTDLEDPGKVAYQGTVDINLADGFEKPKPSPEVVCYQTMLACGELNNKITEYVRGGHCNSAIELKKKVIKQYQEVLELDKYGFIASLLNKETEALALLEKEGITSHSAKKQSYTCSAPGRGYERCGYESDEEEDGDMGFGLFD